MSLFDTLAPILLAAGVGVAATIASVAFAVRCVGDWRAKASWRRVSLRIVKQNDEAAGIITELVAEINSDPLLKDSVSNDLQDRMDRFYREHESLDQTINRRELS